MKQQYKRILESLPLTLPAAIASFGCVAIALLLAGQLHNWLVWPLGLAAAGVAFWVILKSPVKFGLGSEKERFICAGLVLLGVAAWGVWNMQYTAQHLFTNRDPGTYANAAAWLVNHPDLKITTPKVFGEDSQLATSSPGFENPSEDKSMVHAQGLHLFPALLGIAGRVVGEQDMLRLPVLFGMAALLAMFGFARLIMKPRWALLAVGAFALTLPFLYFSRDTYTEPLALTFVFGALALLFSAQKTGDRSLWFLAGLVAGAGALTRIDAYLTLIGFGLFVVLFVLTRPPRQQKTTLLQAGLFSGGVAITSALGLLDIKFLSIPYYQAHKMMIFKELLVLAILLILGGVVLWLDQRQGIIKKLDKTTRAWRAPVAALAVLVIALGLASRPLWQQVMNPVQYDYITEIQQRSGDPVAQREYTELSAQWMAWYLGPWLAALGAGGVALAAARAVRKGNFALLASVLVIGVTTLFYLVKPSIAPDQIWAARRFLPVVLPGLAIFGVLMLERIYHGTLRKQQFGNIFMGVGAGALLLGPLLVSRPFLTHRDTAQHATINGLCQSLPEKAAVLWLGDGQYYTLQATRSFCQVPAMSFVPREVSIDLLAAVAREAQKQGYTPVVAVLGGDRAIVGNAQKQLQQVSDSSFAEIETRLEEPPRNTVVKPTGVWAGLVQENGEIVPLK